MALEISHEFPKQIAVTAGKPPGRSASHPAAPQASLLSVVAVRDASALREHVAAWENLAAAAVEPNVFHEHWMMLPALEHFGADQQQLFLLAYANDAEHSNRPPLLCGFFPLQHMDRYKGLPLPHVRGLQHLLSMLGTPLLRTGYGREALHAILEWLRNNGRTTGLLELGAISADGPFFQLLTDYINEHGKLTYVEETTTRALLRNPDDPEAYLQSAMSSGNRKELRRQRRRLGELGRMETRHLEPADDIGPWIDQFLALEASGWKGREGTALGVHANERAFFQTVAREAHARGRLMMLGIFLDGKPIALKCNFHMGEGAVSFKIAFDEAYSRYSPGVQLELENILQLHQRHDVRWMDSCAMTKHFMINRLWTERRLVQTVLVSTGRRGSDLTVSVLPLLRWLRRLWTRRRKVNRNTGEPS